MFLLIMSKIPRGLEPVQIVVAEIAYSRLPHFVAGRVKNQFGGGGADYPHLVGQLSFQLPWRPARIAYKKAVFHGGNGLMFNEGY